MLANVRAHVKAYAGKPEIVRRIALERFLFAT